MGTEKLPGPEAMAAPIATLVKTGKRQIVDEQYSDAVASLSEAIGLMVRCRKAYRYTR